MTESLVVYQADELPRTLHHSDELYLPDILDWLRVAVSRFFA